MGPEVLHVSRVEELKDCGLGPTRLLDIELAGQGRTRFWPIKLVIFRRQRLLRAPAAAWCWVESSTFSFPRYALDRGQMEGTLVHIVTVFSDPKNLH
jgi:hypothetical protein